MSRQLVWLTVVLCVLAGADTWLRHARAASRAASAVLRPLIPPARDVVPERVRRLWLQAPSEPSPWVYERRGDTWRFPAYFDAYAYADRVQGLLHAVLGTAGTLVTTDTDDFDDLGLTERQALRIGVEDARGQALAEVWVGRGVPGPGGEESYARSAGADTVLHLHANPVLLLGGARPPMLDPHLLPRDERRSAVVEVSVASGEGDSYRLRRVLAPVPEDGPPVPVPGREHDRYRWLLERDGRADTCVDASVYEYLGYLRQVRFERLVAAAAGYYGFDGTRVELTDEEGTRDVLDLGSAAGADERYVRNAGAGLVTVVAGERARWLIPSAAVLLDSLARPTPFERAR